MVVEDSITLIYVRLLKERVVIVSVVVLSDLVVLIIVRRPLTMSLKSSSTLAHPLPLSWGYREVLILPREELSPLAIGLPLFGK